MDNLKADLELEKQIIELGKGAVSLSMANICEEYGVPKEELDSFREVCMSLGRLEINLKIKEEFLKKETELKDQLDSYKRA